MLLEMTRAAQAGLRKERQYELISNHLANAGTTGYKKDILTFDQMMKAKLTTDHSNGDLRITGNELDLALTEQGFFKIQTPAGIRYTRNGNFTLDTENQLVTGQGDLVLGQGGPITIAGSDVHISSVGEILSDGEAVDTLVIANFNSTEQLEKEGQNYFVYKGDPNDEVEPDTIKVVQGSLESANISTVVEMTKMIETQRMYETISKMMHTLDEIDSKVNTMGSPE